MASSELVTTRSRQIASFHGACPDNDPSYSNGPYHPGHSKCHKRERWSSAMARQLRANKAARPKPTPPPQPIVEQTTKKRRKRRRK